MQMTCVEEALDQLAAREAELAAAPPLPAPLQHGDLIDAIERAREAVDREYADLGRVVYEAIKAEERPTP